jgi:hypothetical protein
MRSHIFIHLATTISFAKPFIIKIKIEKEGLPRDSPAGLGAGGLRFKSGRPDQMFQRVVSRRVSHVQFTVVETVVAPRLFSIASTIPASR